MRWMIGMMMLVVMGVAGCGRGGGSATTGPGATTTRGAATTERRGEGRVVSTVPAATLNIVLMGGADSLVGVSTYDVLFLPEGKKDLPVVGNYETMDYERLVALKPTAVVVQMAPSRVPERLKELAAAKHFEIANVRFETTGDLWETVRLLGRISGRELAAEGAVAKAKEELKEIAHEYQGKKRPRVAYLTDTHSMMVVGGGTILNEMIEAAGENAGAEVGPNWPVISSEVLVKLSPEVMLVGDPDGPAQQKDDPRLEKWKRYGIPAVRDHRVFLVTEGDCEMASLDIGKNVRELARLIHANAGATSGPGAEGVK